MLGGMGCVLGLLGEGEGGELVFQVLLGGTGFRLWSLWFRVSGFGFRVSGFGFRVSGFGFMLCGRL